MSCARAAHALARRGIPVFPCRPDTKLPLTTNGFHDASTDPAAITRWFRQWPSANLAIPTGLRSGVFVIDLDQRDAMAQLERDLGGLPRTLTARTPRGGEHLYFRMPPIVLRNSASKLAKGIDSRGEGGYVLAPPSRVAGHVYAWTVRTAPAELPSTWVHAFEPPPRPPAAVEWSPVDDQERTRVDRWCVRALQNEARRLADTPPGSRNDRLWRAGAALGGLVHLGGLSSDDVRAALLWACSTWERRDPRKDTETLERALAFGLTRPRKINLGEVRAA